MGFMSNLKFPAMSGNTSTELTKAHVDALLGLAERLQAVEREAAVVREGIAELASSLGRCAVAPAVPLKAYTVEQVGQAIGLRKSTVYAMIKAGELPTIKRDGTRRVLVADLDRYLETLRDDPSPTGS